MPDVELELTDEEVEIYESMAEDLGMGLNEFINRALSLYVIRLQQEELDKLNIKLEAAHYLILDNMENIVRVLDIITDKTSENEDE